MTDYFPDITQHSQNQRRSTSVARNFANFSDKTNKSENRETSSNWKKGRNTSFVGKNTLYGNSGFNPRTPGSSKKAREILDEAMRTMDGNTRARKTIFPTVESRAKSALKMLGTNDKLTVTREHFALGAYNSSNTVSVIRKTKVKKRLQRVPVPEQKKVDVDALKGIYYINFLDGSKLDDIAKNTLGMENLRQYTKDLCRSIQKSNGEEKRLLKELDAAKNPDGISNQLRICRIIQEKQKKRLDQIVKTANWSVEDIVKELEQEKGKVKSREEEKQMLKKVQCEPAVRARKLLQLSVMEARNIYNRLSTQALCDLVTCYREFATEEKEKEFESILNVCCCSDKRGKELIEILKSMCKFEEQRVNNEQQLTIEEIENKYFAYVGEMGNTKEKIKPEEVRVVYLYLPYLNTEFLEESPMGDKLRELIGFTEREIEVIADLIPAKNMIELMDYYRHNKECKKWGLFGPKEIEQLHLDCGISVDKLLNFVQIVSVMCRESLFVPPSFFAFVTGSLNQNTKELNLSQFAEPYLTCAAMSGLFAFISEKSIPVEKLILEKSKIDEDKAVCIKLLLESSKVPIYSISLSENSLNDRAVELILSGARANSHPSGQLEVLLLDNNSLTPQTGMRIANQIANIGKRTEQIKTEIRSHDVLLRVLSLSQNKLGSIAAESMARSLEKSVSRNTLEYLDLSYNELNDIALIAFANAIGTSKLKLHTLLLLGNKFYDESVKFLAKALMNGSSTKLVNFKLGSLECSEATFIYLLTEGILRSKMVQYFYVTVPYTNSLAIEKANGAYAYKKVICTEIVDLSYYNKNILTAICDAIEIKGEKASKGNAVSLDQYFIEKFVTKAYEYNALEILIFLITQGYIVSNKIIKDGMAISHCLAEIGDIQCVEYLIRNGVSPILPTSIGNKNYPYASVLHIAAFHGYVDLVQRLLFISTKSNVVNLSTVAGCPDLQGNTPLHYAAREGKLDVCNILSEIFPEAVATKNKFRNLPFHLTIVKDKLDTFIELSRITADSLGARTIEEFWDSYKGEGGCNSLLLAVKYSAKQIFLHLVKCRVLLNIQDDRQKTALHWALDTKGSESMISQLIYAKAGIDTEDETGETPAFIAVKKGLYTSLIELDNAGAALNRANNYNNTLLHYAAKAERADIIGFLIEKGLTPLARNKEGLIPQDIAMKPHIKKMLSVNVDPSVRSVKNEIQTPFSESNNEIVGSPPMNTSVHDPTDTYSEIMRYAHSDKSVYGPDIAQLNRKNTFSTNTIRGLYPFMMEENKVTAPRTILGVFFNEDHDLADVPPRETMTDMGYMNATATYSDKPKSVYSSPQRDIIKEDPIKEDLDQ